MFIYNCIVNETAAFEWFWGDFLQLYLKYKKMHSGIVAQIYNYTVNSFRMCDALPYAKDGTLSEKLNELFG